MRPKVLRFCTTLMLVLLTRAPAVLALPMDKNAPVHIKADSVTFNHKTGLSQYEGNVRFTQGSIRIEAENITVEQKDSQLVRVTCIGQPAIFKQRPEVGAAEIVAQAQRIVYQVTGERLWLTEQAKLWDGSTEFSSEQIEFDLVRSVVLARKGGAKNGAQVEMIIAPRQPERRPHSP